MRNLKPAISCALLAMVIVALLPGLTWPAAITLQEQLSTADIAPHIEFFVDTDEQHDVSSITSVEFQPNQDDSLNLGAVQGHVWMRFAVTNANAEHSAWMLSLNRALLADLKIYIRPVGNGAFAELFDIRKGDMEKDSLRQYGTLATRLTLPAGETQEILLRFKGYNSYALPITLESELDLARKRNREVSFFLIVAAGVMTFVLYNALVHGVTGSKPFLFYSLAQLAMLAYFAHIEGVTTAYLWPHMPSLGAALAPIFGTIISVSIIAFARSFIADQPDTGHWTRALNAALALSSFALLLALSSAVFGIPANTMVQGAAYITSFITWLLLPVLAISATIWWQHWHWPLIPAWVAMSGFTFYTSAVFAGLAPISEWHPYVYGIAAYCEAGFLSLALALRLRHQRQRHLSTEQQLNISLQRELDTARKTAQIAESRAVLIGELAQRENLMRTASHDSRQLVATLKQTAYAMEHGADEATIRNVLNGAADYLDNVLSTTSNAAIGGGYDDNVIALDTFPVAELLEPMKLLFEQAAAEKGIRFELHSTHTDVATDRALLLRLLANLVSNAIKYTASGTVSVSAERLQGTLQLRVQDNGTGMTQAQIETLLERHSPSVRFAATPNGSGTGWKVIRDLAGRLHAGLDIDSSADHGTTVFINLPQPQNDNPGTSLVTELDLDACSQEEALSRAQELQRQGSKFAVTTFDRSLEIRRQISATTPFLLYKPVTPLARAALREIFA